MKHSTLIFDLDGTLSNPLAGMADSINHALLQHGHPARPIDEIAGYIGPPLEGTLEAVLGTDDQDLIGAIIKSYREHYLLAGYRNNDLYDGIPEMIRSLKQDGVSIGVCTSKLKSVATKILTHFGLIDQFEFVSGGDIGIKKGQQLKELLAEGFIDQQAVMIGDRDVDVIAAKQNGLASAGVLWGFGSVEELTGAGADFHIKTPLDLRHLV